MVKFGTMEMKRALALTMVTMFFVFWWQLFFTFTMVTMVVGALAIYKLVLGSADWTWSGCQREWVSHKFGGKSSSWSEVTKTLFYNDIWSKGQKQSDREFVKCFTQERFPKFQLYLRKTRKSRHFWQTFKGLRMEYVLLIYFVQLVSFCTNSSYFLKTYNVLAWIQQITQKE